MNEINLKEKINKCSDFISIRQIFDEIREKTDIKKDYEIAESLIPVVKKCDAYNRYKLNNGKPMRLLWKNPSDKNTDLDYKLMEIASGELYVNDNQILNNYAIERWDFYFEFNKLYSCDLENIEIYKVLQDDETIPFDDIVKEGDQKLNQIDVLHPTINYAEPYLRPLFLTDLFTRVEAACLISGDDPIRMNALIDSGDLNYNSHYTEHSQAVKTIERAILANNLELQHDLITRESLQKYLLNRGLTIQNFNTDIALELLAKDHIGTAKIGHATHEHYQEQRDQLSQENIKLKAEIDQLKLALNNGISNASVKENKRLLRLIGAMLEESKQRGLRRVNQGQIAERIVEMTRGMNADLGDRIVKGIFSAANEEFKPYKSIE